MPWQGQSPAPSPCIPVHEQLRKHIELKIPGHRELRRQAHDFNLLFPLSSCLPKGDCRNA
eukprot:1161695-Pelagomonas_calceolata.AAC.5